jgi:hypothetical protein
MCDDLSTDAVAMTLRWTPTLDGRAGRAGVPSPLEDRLAERMDLRDAELARVDERGVLDGLLGLSARLRRRVQGRREEEGEQVSPPIALALPDHRAEEVSDLDGDCRLLEHLPRRRLLERLARLVVAGRNSQYTPYDLRCRIMSSRASCMTIPPPPVSVVQLTLPSLARAEPAPLADHGPTLSSLFKGTLEPRRPLVPGPLSRI